MCTVPTNTDDVIDSRDIIEYIETLREEVENGSATLDERCDLAALQNFASEMQNGGCSDWEYGATLVRESYWVAYVQELLEDTGYLPTDLPGFIHIDWEWTAQEVRIDYVCADYDGVTYWARA